MIDYEEIKDIAIEMRSDGEPYAKCDGFEDGAFYVLNSIGSCGECEYWKEVYNDRGIETQTVMRCELDGIIRKKDFYCANFERKTND